MFARFASLAICLIAVPLLAAEPPKVAGIWLGTLKVGALELRLAFTIEAKPDGALTFKMDSIDQGAKGLASDIITFKDDELTLELTKLLIKYQGKLQADGKVIKGEFVQRGVKFPLDLERVDKIPETNRPQTPKKPYPYLEEEVTFPSKAEGATLAGTLTMPKGDGPFPTVVLITGSGPQNRNETLLGHHPFLVLADYLTRQGIAVLRYDDRGVAKSTGTFATATSQDFAQDASGAVSFLKTRPKVGAIGLIGHSEGGLIAPMVAVENPQVGFIILLAGPGLPGDEILFAQGKLIVKAMGGDEATVKNQREVQQELFDLVKTGADEQKIKDVVEKMKAKWSEKEKKELGDNLTQQISTLKTNWFKFFLNHDPRPTLQKVKCPVLAINGELDLQVPSKENLAEIEKVLRAGGNKNVTIQEFPGLNHLFQTTKTGLPSEYGKIEETFSPKVMEAIAKWTLLQVRNAE
jgi:pimeloyl-ACP methyl ester carboxylesterase